MKALVFIALTAMSSLAMANGGGGGGGSSAPSSPTTQTSIIVNTSVINTSDGWDSESQQNLASNAGSFTSTNTVLQSVFASDALIMNTSTTGGASNPKYCLECWHVWFAHDNVSNGFDSKFCRH